MTRAGSIVGTLLGLVCVTSWATGDARVGVPGAVAGVILLVAAVVAWKERLWGRVVLGLCGFLLLVRFLPVFFQAGCLWPCIPIILLGSLTLGFSALGILLDRFHAGGDVRSRP